MLPFANMSDDKGNGFFVDGVHDEVITALAKIHDLKVFRAHLVMGLPRSRRAQPEEDRRPSWPWGRCSKAACNARATRST